MVNGLGGNLGTIFGSRLSSGLHLGYIELSWKDKRLWENIRLSFLVGVFIFTVMGVLVWGLAPLMGLGTGDISFWEFLAIAMLSGVLITIIAILVSVVTAFVSFRRGIDPDNVVTPLVTTIGDLSGITLLIIFVILIL
jgi:mgtE-like transporter